MDELKIRLLMVAIELGGSEAEEVTSGMRDFLPTSVPGYEFLMV